MKTRNKIIILILSLITFIIVMSSCQKENENEYDESEAIRIINELNDEGLNMAGIASVLSEAGYKEIGNMIPEDDTTLNEYLENYVEARKSNNLAICNSILYNIGMELLKNSICNSLGISSKDVISFEVYNEETNRDPININKAKIKYVKTTINNIPGVGDVSNEEEKEIDFLLTGEADDMAINIGRCKVAGWNLEGIDQVYLAYERFLISQPIIDLENKKFTLAFDDEYSDEMYSKLNMNN